MTVKRLWMLVTFGGVLILLAGVVVMVLLIIDTGTKHEGSACSSLRAPASIVASTCYTSNDPTVFWGLIPMGIGGVMFGIGVARWTSASRAEREVDDPPSPSGPQKTLKEIVNE